MTDSDVRESAKGIDWYNTKDIDKAKKGYVLGAYVSNVSDHEFAVVFFENKLLHVGSKEECQEIASLHDQGKFKMPEYTAFAITIVNGEKQCSISIPIEIEQPCEKNNYRIVAKTWFKENNKKIRQYAEF